MAYRDRNILLDLDETLVHTHEHEYKGNQKKLYSYENEHYMVNSTDLMDDGKIVTTLMWGLRRPHLNEFLKFCFDNFGLVIVWSAGSERYVKDTVNRVFYETGSPHYIFTQKDCYIDENGLTKPIKYLKENNHKLNIDLSNTIIIDDREENFYLNKENGILIPEFNSKSIQKDANLLKLKKWFEKGSFTKRGDVRSIDKTSIFS